MTPPRLARWWIRLLAPAELRDSLADDVADVAAAAPHAYWRYWAEAAKSTPHLIRLRVEAARERRWSQRAHAIGGSRAGAIEGLRRDVRHAFRGTWREPTFALTATLTLALGIGITTTTFSIVDAELWKPLPFPNPHELVKAGTRVSAEGATEAVSGAEIQAWREGVPAFAAVAGEIWASRQALQLETATSVAAAQVTANYFDVLPRRVIAGRVFAVGESGRLAVLTERAWERIFERRPDLVGRTVLLDGQPIDVIGVIETNDALGGDADLFVSIDERGPAFRDPDNAAFYGVVARLAAGASRDVALQQLSAVVARRAAERGGGSSPRPVFVEDFNEYHKSSDSRLLYFLLGVSIVVLLLSAVNVAALVLGRAFGRRREFALRGALGGGVFAVARQLFAEGAAIAAPACAIGILAATWAVGAIATRLEGIYRGTDIPVDYRAAAFACAVAGLTAIAFAVAPLTLTRRLDLSAALGAGGRGGRSRGEGRARAILLTVQLALTMVLVAGAAILLKSFVTLTRVPLGFEPQNVLSVRAPLGGPRYQTDAQVLEYAERMRTTANALPGVDRVAVASTAPLGSGPLVNFAMTDRPAPEPGKEPRGLLRAVGAGYFQTLGIAIRRGRVFTDADSATAPRVAIVNEVLAARLDPNGDVVGRTIELLPGARATWTRRPGVLTIIGVAANVKEVEINETEIAGLYVPFAQMPPRTVELVVHTAVDAATVMPILRTAVANIDPAIAMGAVTTFAARVEGSLRADRFKLQLVAGLAVAGVVLAAVGIYGTVAFAVQARTREFGVRLAVGARPAGLMATQVWHACRLGVAGGIAGLVLIALLARAIGNALYLVPGEHVGLLYGVTTTDPAMLAAAFVGIVATAMIAASIPARRIARVDPVRALRGD